MKNKLTSCLALSFALFTASANSSVITTTFEAGNHQSGNMFDVVNLIDDINVTGFDLNLDSGTWGIEVYAKSGTWVGFDNDHEAWDLIDAGTVTSVGENQGTFFDVSDFLLDGGATSALYITSTSGIGTMNYTDGTGVGNIAVDNGDLQILEGAGVEYASGTDFTPRIWNGSIHYQVASVPAPASIAFLGLALIGFGFSKRRTKS